LNGLVPGAFVECIDGENQGCAVIDAIGQPSNQEIITLLQNVRTLQLAIREGF
jgi:hypothetical protein